MRKDPEGGKFQRRRAVGAASLAIAAILAFASVAILFIIVGHVFVNGIGSLNADFFTKIPTPYGESGGGIAQAIMGTVMMLLLAAIIAIPFGVGTAIYIVEFGRGRFAEVVRFAVELLAELPSIVVGVFVWALVSLTAFGLRSRKGGVRQRGRAGQPEAHEYRERLVGDIDMALDPLQVPAHPIKPACQRRLQPVGPIRRQMRGQCSFHD